MEVREPEYRRGDWNAVCDRCAHTFLASALRLEWTGLRVCKACFEPRHPQEKMKGRKDPQAVPWTRPEPEGVDVSPGSGNEVKASDL